MFDPVEVSHDEAVDAAINAVARTTSGAVTRAFLASLSTRRLELRSALGSYAVGRHMQAHSSAGARCVYCGEYQNAADPNILNFERIKWGGVRHYNPRYIALDLEALAAEGAVTPTDEDRQILRSIFETAKGIGQKGRLGDLERALSGLFPSNSSERRTLIGILGYAGILIDPGRPDFRRGFVPDAKREQTPWHKDDWPYPVQWWTGSCGVSESAIDEWFPDLENGS
ncbi:hypothetical protein [Flavisphingomonas formosensis]|uniref:hypothetical protein n=1 Tax=Flavisphingomonas formosensis TaxID=861534 RepID=UPI0012FC928B|nr:hypothetical protein [Sphingomonas formosensis]